MGKAMLEGQRHVVNELVTGMYPEIMGGGMGIIDLT